MGAAAAGSVALAVSAYGGHVAREEAKVVKEKWEELRGKMEYEVGDGKNVSIWVSLPRAIHLGVLFFPLAWLSVPTLCLSLLEERYDFVKVTLGWAGETLRDLWFTVLRLSLERSGAAFIKWGQWAATRPDMFPRKMCQALNSLHDSVPPHAWVHTERSIKNMYKVEDIGEVFDEFDQRPIGSGSIAQVYRARFRGQDQNYAIKVRHPGVERQLLTDFALLSAFGDVIDRVPALRWMGIKESVAQFAHTLGVQVRLDFEAANLDLFNANFRACPHVTTSFPSPKLFCDQWGLHVSEDVLVESFEEGHSVAAYCAAAAAQKLYEAARASEAALRTATHMNTILVSRVTRTLKHAANSAQLAVYNAVEDEMMTPHEDKPKITPLPPLAARHVVQTGKETYLQMLLVDNFIHADMHPGNIIVHLTPGMPLPKLVLIDAGMVDVMGGDQQDNFIGLFKAMGAGDGKAAASHLMKFSDTQEAADIKGFEREIIGLFEERCKGFGTGVDVGDVLQGVLDALRKHHVRVDGNYATSVVNLLCIESIAAALDPQYNLLDESENLLRAHTLLGRENLALCMAFAAPVLASWRSFVAWVDLKTSPKPKPQPAIRI